MRLPYHPWLRKTWDESAHKRGQPENAGEFASTGGGSKNSQSRPTARPKRPVRASFTDTPEFKEQFAGSKIVNSDGTPLLVYTGQPKGLDEIPQTGRNELPFGHAYFTTDKSVAMQYAGTHTDEMSGKTSYSLGRKGEVYPAYLSIKNPLNLDKFDESEWVKYLLPDVDVETGYSSKDLAKALGLEAETDWDEDRGKNILIGYVTDGGQPLDRNFDLEDAIRRLWEERSGSGDTLEIALSNSPAGQLMVMFPEVGERYVEANGNDGFIFNDEEMGGKTIIPFESDQIIMPPRKKGKSFSHPWLVAKSARFEEGKHKRDHGRFSATQGARGQQKPSVDRTNDALDAAMAEPARGAKPATGPIRGANPDLDAFMAMGNEPAKSQPQQKPQIAPEHVQAAKQVLAKIGRIFPVKDIEATIGYLKQLLGKLPPQAQQAFAEMAGLTEGMSPKDALRAIRAAANPDNAGHKPPPVNPREDRTARGTPPPLPSRKPAARLPLGTHVRGNMVRPPKRPVVKAWHPWLRKTWDESKVIRADDGTFAGGAHHERIAHAIAHVSQHSREDLSGDTKLADDVVESVKHLPQSELFRALTTGGLEGVRKADSKTAMLQRLRNRITAAHRARERAEV